MVFVAVVLVCHADLIDEPGAKRSVQVPQFENEERASVEVVELTVSASLTLARDHLLLGSYDGTLTAVSLDGRVAWTYPFDDSIVAPVAVGDQSVYVPLLRGRIVKLR